MISKSSIGSSSAAGSNPYRKLEFQKPRFVQQYQTNLDDGAIQCAGQDVLSQASMLPWFS